jgi:hypothetical protein
MLLIVQADVEFVQSLEFHATHFLALCIRNGRLRIRNKLQHPAATARISDNDNHYINIIRQMPYTILAKSGFAGLKSIREYTPVHYQ